MNSRTMTARVAGPSVLAAMALASWSTTAPAADDLSAAERERERQVLLDLERRAEQEQGRRDIEARERMQREALRGQEESIRRLEESRRRLEQNAREVAELSTELGRDFAYSFGTQSVGPMPRSLLGVSLTGGQRGEGARVAGVSPGGAAAEAGIQVGDLITRVDDLDLTGEAAPDRALSEKMATIEPDTKVKVAVNRQGRKMDFELVTRPAPVRAPTAGVRMVAPQVQRLDNLITLSPIADSLAGLEFATLSEKLGSYFGVSSGVLVVRAGADAPFTLQDGDVILSIDGRTPSSSQHAARILRSYQPGEKLKLRVQRDRRAIDVETTAPGTSRAPR